MSVRIGSNISSLQAQRRLGDASSVVEKTYERLSSGQRINKAADDAAGLAVSSSLNLKAKVLGQGYRNLQDGVSLLTIAGGALSQLSTVTQRQLELATQAASGTVSGKQRQSLQQEAEKLGDEFNRIINTTEFNGQRLLTGDVSVYRLQAGIGDSESLELALGTELSRTVGASSALTVQSGAAEISEIDFAKAIVPERTRAYLPNAGAGKAIAPNLVETM